MNTERVVRLPSELDEKLVERAARLGISTDEAVRLAVNLWTGIHAINGRLLGLACPHPDPAMRPTRMPGKFSVPVDQETP